LSQHVSTPGRIALLVTLVMVIAVGAGAFLTRALDPWWLGWVMALLVAIPIVWIGVDRITAPTINLIRAVTDGIDSLRDNDFSVSIADQGRNEVATLIAAHNELGDALRTERQTLYQRELLLDTVIQTTDIALVLTNRNGRIVYSNAAARQLMNAGKPINGLEYRSVLDGLPGAFAEAVNDERDGLFTVEADEPETWHLSQEAFTLNAQPHRLYLFKQLTQELGRQEVATWKKVIRLISHELNNSLAPISSLAHSGKTVVTKTDADEQLLTIFATIEDRSSHLKNFIESYARFARLPAPRPKDIDWPAYLEGLRNTVEFSLAEPLPDIRCRVDPGQFEQVLINIFKNAHESGSPVEKIRLRVEQHPSTTIFAVSDAGGGVSDEVLQSALLPFYSTKKSGTGLGLPLCREIVEAHGGRLSLGNVEPPGLEVRIAVPSG
jgi:nitrogen fixation/metabolism regulation signal transduction histidine kinase